LIAPHSALPKRLARISALGKLLHQFDAVEQFHQLVKSCLSRDVFSGDMASEYGLRFEDRINQYVVVHGLLRRALLKPRTLIRSRSKNQSRPLKFGYASVSLEAAPPSQRDRRLRIPTEHGRPARL
jgi:hypothetical protein